MSQFDLDVTHYIEFLSATGGALSTPQRYQPYFIGETRTFNGLAYQFSPFSVSGDVSTQGTETGDFELIAPANLISSAKLWQASEDRYLIKISTVLLACTPPADVNGIPTWNELNFLSSTIRVCDAFGYSDAIPADAVASEEDNFSPVTLRLASPLNFVAGTAPTRRLTAAQVGPLPASGGIAF
jgi:hypothetical protein